jgi:hypothetical protein
MPTRPEMLRDETMGREEALGVAGRFESLHPPLPLPCRLVGVLDSVIQIAVLAEVSELRIF